MLKMFFIILATMSIHVHAISLQLEKNVPRGIITGVPSLVSFKIFASPVAVAPIAQQSFTAGNWEADYDFTNFKTIPQDMVRFKALFTSTNLLDPNSTYYYEIELDSIVKGNRELLNNQAWLLYKEATITRTTALPVSCFCLSTVPNGVWTKVADLGSFTKYSSTSLIDIDFTGTIFSSSFAGTGITYEFRIDNAVTSKGTVRTLIRNQNSYEVSNASGIFPSLSSGSHQVSVWVYSWFGTAGQTCVAPGCFSTDQVLVKEYAGF